MLPWRNNNKQLKSRSQSCFDGVQFINKALVLSKRHTVFVFLGGDFFIPPLSPFSSGHRFGWRPHHNRSRFIDKIHSYLSHFLNMVDYTTCKNKPWLSIDVTAPSIYTSEYCRVALWWDTVQHRHITGHRTLMGFLVQSNNQLISPG